MNDSGALHARWKSLKGAIASLEDAALKEAILDYRAAVLDLEEANLELRAEVSRLESRLHAQDDFVFERNVCWRTTEEGGREGAYCPSCLEGADRPIHLTMTKVGLRCPFCDQSYTLGA